MMYKTIFNKLIRNKVTGGGKWLILSNIATLIVLVVVANHFNLRRYIMVKIGLEEKLPDDYWAVVGWNNTIMKLDYQCDVCFFGNSITQESDFRKFFPATKILNCGYPGDNLKGMLLRIPPIRYVNPKAVFAMGGINGLSSQSMDEFEKQYAKFAQMLLDSIPNADIYLQSILPINTEMKRNLDITPEKIIEANRIIKNFAVSHQRCFYIDLYSIYEKQGVMPQELTRDGLHIYSHAYRRWAEKIRPYIERYSQR